MKPWNRWWTLGWIVILTPTLLYEFTAAALEYFGYTAFPTLSRVIVGTVPQPLLDGLTLAIALVLVWHWHVVAEREHRGPTVLETVRDLRHASASWWLATEAALAAFVLALKVWLPHIYTLDLSDAAIMAWLPGLVQDFALIFLGAVILALLLSFSMLLALRDAGFGVAMRQVSTQARAVSLTDAEMPGTRDLPRNPIKRVGAYVLIWLWACVVAFGKGGEY